MGVSKMMDMNIDLLSLRFRNGNTNTEDGTQKNLENGENDSRIADDNADDESEKSAADPQEDKRVVSDSNDDDSETTVHDELTDGENEQNTTEATSPQSVDDKTLSEQGDITETTVSAEQPHAEPRKLNKGTVTLAVTVLLVLAVGCAVVALLLKKGSGKKKKAQYPARNSGFPASGNPAGSGIADAQNVMDNGDEFSTAPIMPFNPEDSVSGTSAIQTQPMVGAAIGQKNQFGVISVHNIGKRPNQEDSFGVSDMTNQELTEKKGLLGVVADGMGGLAGGEDVSSLLVLDMLQQFSDNLDFAGPGAELDKLLKHAVTAVNEFLVNSVGLKKSGSTLMAVICKDHQLSWVSVGDSRIVLYRNGKIISLNQQHVYGAELDEMVRQGKMTAAEAQSNPHRGELTSYVGMGELKYVDRSVRPMSLLNGDKIVLMSDGVFNSLSDEEIASVLSLPSNQIGETLEQSVLAKQKKYQDNFTALIIEI